MDHSLYVKGDANYDQACTLLDSYRLHEGVLENGAPILDFFDLWIKEVNPKSVNIVDALFDLLLEDYNPTTDEQLLSRIPLVMNQILQRKYSQSDLVKLMVDAKKVFSNYFGLQFSLFNSP